MVDAWSQIGATVASEFADVPDLAQATRIALRLIVAAVLGGLLGLERERAGKSAGVRTHMLVAMGAALFVLVAQQVGIDTPDMSRVIQGIVAGVGFLGAGTILKGDSESQVHGLTTAAGIWLTSAIGVAAGLGQESTAVLSAVLAFTVLWALPKLPGFAAAATNSDNSSNGPLKKGPSKQGDAQLPTDDARERL